MIKVDRELEVYRQTYWQLGQFFQNLSGGDGRVEGRSTSNQEKPTTTTDFGDEILKIKCFAFKTYERITKLHAKLFKSKMQCLS